MAHVIAVGNRKGGVGKTSYVLNLANALQIIGCRVLVGDLDPQRNLTDVLVGNQTEFDLTIFDAVYNEQAGTLGQVVVSTDFEGISLLPGDEQLARIEAENLMAPEQRLRNAADGSGIDEEYDVILLDMPPALGRLTLNGLIYANETRVVADAEAFSVKGVVKYLELVDRVRGSAMYNRSLGEPKVVINRYARTAEHAYQRQALVDAYGEAVVEPEIPRTTAIADGQSARVPLTRISSRGAAKAAEAFTLHAHAIKKELNIR
ncbi:MULTISPECIES: ParA family protein [Micrococcaceae]|jgi:chromosome partitioning protein|uniref:ParA family protein n=1 Tax=Micrococcaceae TaxID=1268 RepID=UPI0010A7A1A4|nr:MULTISPECIES: ParA family protein [Micrococcaceae]QOT19495.1 ParA family protein [Paenarthrobacter sp. YJN-5]